MRYPKQRYRAVATRLLNSLANDKSVEIVPLSVDRFSRALHLYSERPDKEWGLTDCISFVVMTDRRITNALTTDAHFQQAGFQALMARQ
jgi:predicted nucleic acid-binding protein